jgi:hypothetical protein
MTIDSYDLMIETQVDYPVPTEEEYLKEVREEWCWSLLRTEAEDNLRETYKEAAEYNEGNEDWVAEYDEHCIGSVFLGTVFSLLPSGKFYTLWANSNVSPCDHCEGTGKLNFVVKCEHCEGKGHTLLSQEQYDYNPELWDKKGYKVGTPMRCLFCNGRRYVEKECPWCDGEGSEEAYRDQLYYAALDTLAEEQGGYIFSGEGDPCDIFFGIAYDQEIIDRACEEGETDA